MHGDSAVDIVLNGLAAGAASRITRRTGPSPTTVVLEWAAKIAAACRRPQDVSTFGVDPAVGN
jgi:hypothetical protein